MFQSKHGKRRKAKERSDVFKETTTNSRHTITTYLCHYLMLRFYSKYPCLSLRCYAYTLCAQQQSFAFFFWLAKIWSQSRRGSKKWGQMVSLGPNSGKGHGLLCIFTSISSALYLQLYIFSSVSSALYLQLYGWHWLPAHSDILVSLSAFSTAGGSVSVNVNGPLEKKRDKNRI